MKHWRFYIDEKGCIIHKPGNEDQGGDGTPTGGGDSSNRCGHYWFTAFFTGHNPAEASGVKDINTQGLINWSKRAGCIIRHWRGYNKAFDKQYGTSRDQFMPFAIAALVHNTIRGHKLFDYYKRRHGMMPNFRPLKGDWHGDFLLPDHRSSLIRANPKTKRLGFKIIFGDVWRFFHMVIRVILSHINHDKWVGDSLNFNQEIILGLAKQPWFLTKLTGFLWAKLVYGGPQWQLDHYFRQSHAPPINDLYRPIHDKYYPEPLFKAK